MPKARILSHQIDKDSIETLDQKEGLFNPVKVEDVRNFDSVSQDAMEERAIENGILDKAFENAKNIIRKIIEYAKEHFHAKNITYRQMALEDICQIDEQFDLITSSLAFDYAEDLDKLMKNIYGLLKYGAHFVFSMSHPMATAWDGQYDRYTRTESGERLYANISNYMVEGKRTVKWVVEDYEVYHRTFSSIVNSIVNAGFLIEECEESHVSDEMRKQYPAQFGGTLHRPDFIFFRCKKQS